MNRVRAAAAILSVAVLVGGASGVANAQAVPVYAETITDTLDRHVKTLARSPKDFAALIGAGKAALQMGDEQAAAGFFGRAEEVSPGSPLPKMGIGAALVASGEPAEALTYFSRAQQLGGSVTAFGADRGLAYDLLGQQAAAQMDYRAALSGPDASEARRRLALSQAISGDTAGALATLQPLLLRYDRGATRCRSLVLALAGDVVGAKAALDSVIPGASRPMEPFFHRLRMLSSQQKAAAVHLGMFPEGGTSYAYAGPQPVMSAPAYRSPAPHYAPPVRTAASMPAAAATAPRVPPASSASKVWLQLASGSDPSALPVQFHRIKRSTRDLLDGIDGYVVQDNNRVRLLIGPFRNKVEANIFAEDLAALDVDAFSWTNRPDQAVRKLPLE